MSVIRVTIEVFESRSDPNPCEAVTATRIAMGGGDNGEKQRFFGNALDDAVSEAVGVIAMMHGKDT